MILDDPATRADPSQINADLRRERDEALAREAAMAEVLRVINSSPGDLAPVFDAMLEKATRLCEAELGFLSTYDGEQFRTAALHRVPPALAELWLSAPPEPGPNSALTRLALGENLVHIEDYAAYRAYTAGEPRARALVDVGGVRPILLCLCGRTDGCWARSRSIARRCGRFPTSRLHCCRISRPRRSSRWRTRGF